MLRRTLRTKVTIFLSCSLVKDSVCQIQKRRPHLFITVLQKTTNENPYFQLYYQAAVTLTLKIMQNGLRSWLFFFFLVFFLQLGSHPDHLLHLFFLARLWCKKVRDKKPDTVRGNLSALVASHTHSHVHIWTCWLSHSEGGPRPGLRGRKPFPSVEFPLVLVNTMRSFFHPLMLASKDNWSDYGYYMFTVSIATTLIVQSLTSEDV